MCVSSASSSHRPVAISLNEYQQDLGETAYHMARQGMENIEMSVAVVLVVMLVGGAAAQSGCSTALISLSSCLNYVTGSSATPSSSCCSRLGSVVQSQPRCLCLLLNNGGGSSLGVSINQSLALALPGACKVQTPPASQCNTAANGPAAATVPAASPVSSPGDASIGVPESSPGDASNKAPASSPADASDDVPGNNPSSSVPTNPSGMPSKTVPATGGHTSGGSIVKPSFGAGTIALFLSALVSIVIKI